MKWSKLSSPLWLPAKCKFLVGLFFLPREATSQAGDDDDDDEEDDEEETDDDGDGKWDD